MGKGMAAALSLRMIETLANMRGERYRSSLRPVGYIAAIAQYAS